MRVRRKFLELTRSTYPYGTESMLKYALPKGTKKDEHGNYYISVGDSYSTMFTCHLDTAAAYQKPVKHIQNNNIIRTDGTTILGADDKAGMVVVLYMIEKKVPGLYYFFIGEEVGCIGSSRLAGKFDLKHIDKVISFDRRGTTSVITHQLFGRCCSDEFAQSLSNSLNDTNLGLKLSPDDTGILTDSAQFVDLVSECTNISVGYLHEHTVDEQQDIEYLSRLCRACCQIDWESLPVMRDPNYAYYNSGLTNQYLSKSNNFLGDSYDLDIYDCEPYPGYKDIDSHHEFVTSNYCYIKAKEGTIKAYISRTWIENEKILIHRFLKSQGYYPAIIEWNGIDCKIAEVGETEATTFGNRTFLNDIVPDFAKGIPYIHLRKNINDYTWLD